MKNYLYLILTAFMAILIILALPRKKVFHLSGEELLDKINRKTHIISIHKYKEMKTQEPGLQLVDLRDNGTFTAGHLPGAMNLPSERLGPDIIHRFFKESTSTGVLYAEETYRAEKYWILFTQMGMDNLFVLDTGPMLDSLIRHWDAENSRMILVDETPEFNFQPDSAISF
ncbi:MAG: hypothetical protein AMS26_01930 [Bacteroides sp. SM23_62]|nr:MAG: hypothetical protein AMS26_01930 [Bacteroides sp. SM23_62]